MPNDTASEQLTDVEAARKEIRDGFLELKWFLDDAPLTAAQRRQLDEWLIDQQIRIGDLCGKLTVQEVLGGVEVGMKRAAATAQRPDSTWAAVISASPAVQQTMSVDQPDGPPTWTCFRCGITRGMEWEATLDRETGALRCHFCPPKQIEGVVTMDLGDIDEAG